MYSKHGPATLAKSYCETIRIFIEKKLLNQYFLFTYTSHLSFKNFINHTNKLYSIAWFLYSTYFTKANNIKYSANFHSTIYGPMVSPKKWFLFPQNNTFEKKWSYYINRILAYVAQSERVKQFLIYNSMKIDRIEEKYIVSHGCLLPNNSIPIIQWNKRIYDILIYGKFSDINKEKELKQLINILKSNYTIILIRYGNHSKASLLKYSSISKLLIYYSYYDCWPSSLMEMQNMGIVPIVQQSEFISKYGFYVKDFNKNKIELIDIIYIALSSNYNSVAIGNFYRRRNNCLNIFKETLIKIYYIKTKKRITSL